jgi:hypothetical protein
VNYQKSNIYSLNTSDEKNGDSGKYFWVSSGKLPFYIPRIITRPNKPNVDDMLPLVQRIERRLLSTSNFQS